jgi:hypothetical protein
MKTKAGMGWALRETYCSSPGWNLVYQSAANHCVHRAIWARHIVVHIACRSKRNYTVGYAKTNKCYNEQFVLTKSECYN